MKSRLLAAALVAGLAVGCSGVTEPRRAVADAIENPATFLSPRSEYVVEASPDIGDISLRGVVQGREPVEQFAPSDGDVLEVFFARGDAVALGDPVLTFLPQPSAAERIELEIAELEIELATELDDTDALAAADQAYDDLISSFEERAVTITATTDGLIGPTRQNIRYSVEADEALFTLADPSDTLVGVEIDRADITAFTTDTPVSMTFSSNEARSPLSGRLFIDRQAEGDQDEGDTTVLARVELDDPTAVELGDRLIVFVPIEAGSGRWVPEAALHRSGGRSFLLVATGERDLKRVDVQLGQRSNTHVQVLSPLDAGTRLVLPT